MLLKCTVATSRDVAWHVYYSNRRAKPRLLATSLLVKSFLLTLVANRQQYQDLKIITTEKALPHKTNLTSPLGFPHEERGRGLGQ